MRKLIVLLLMGISTVVMAQQPPTGAWKIVRLLPVSTTYSSESNIRRHLHKRLMVTDLGIKFGNKFCKFEEQQTLQSDTDATEFFLKNKTDYSALDVHAPVTIFDTECSTLIVWSGGLTSIVLGGDEYELTRVTTKAAVTSK